MRDSTNASFKWRRRGRWLLVFLVVNVVAFVGLWFAVREVAERQVVATANEMHSEAAVVQYHEAEFSVRDFVTLSFFVSRQVGEGDDGRPHMAIEIHQWSLRYAMGL